MADLEEILEVIQDQVEEQEGKVEEISLDSLELTKIAPEVAAALEKHKDTLTALSMNDCAITSLDKLPTFPNLIRIELNDNKLSGKDLERFATCKKLQSLSFGGNTLEAFKDLEVLKGLTELTHIDLFGCPIEKVADLRQKVFKLFPKLEIFNNQDKDGNEIEIEDDEDFEGGEDGEDDEEEFDEDEEEEEEEVKPKKKTKKN